ncbi:MAG TPA: DUF2259 domain-containing protein [Treponema sp.]|nr:DUF2259 domain-containing protein [Treponema sp.]
MRKTVFIIICIAVAGYIYAGDIANFVNIGFSSDGSRFVFGQHGITDGDYQAYADIYCVDVPTNRFIPGGTYSKNPSKGTVGKEGTSVFSTLRDTVGDYLKKLEVDGKKTGRALYVQAEDEKRPNKLEFRDFETGRFYSVSMHAYNEGSGASVRSSFYLVLEIVYPDGKTDNHTIGLPGFKRKGVSDYRIRRILTNESGNSLVFVVEKTVSDRNGDSIRYMVETLTL